MLDLVAYLRTDQFDEPRYARTNALDRQARYAHAKAVVCGVLIGIVVTNRFDQDAALCRGPRKRFDIEIRWRAHPVGRTADFRRDFHRHAAHPVQRIAQRDTALLQHPAQAHHQCVVMAERQEERHAALVVQWRVIHDRPAQRAGTLDELRVGHDKAELHARREYLGKTGDVDDAAGVVHAA